MRVFQIEAVPTTSRAEHFRKDDERAIARLARDRNRQRGPGAFAGMMLADNGADVIRIDRSGHLRLAAGRHRDAARSVVQRR
jgi:outer membrane receptor protein involved in Fe transport